MKIDLGKEYMLVLQKKSKFTAAQRKKVMHMYLQRYNRLGGEIYAHSKKANIKVQIFPHGFVQFIGEAEDAKKLLKEMQKVSFKKLAGKGATPYEIFEHMGWVEEQLDADAIIKLQITKKED